MITIIYECRRPKFDVDANQQPEVLMLTPSCVAAVDVLISGQALSTQAQRSALTHFATCPLLDLLLPLYHKSGLLGLYAALTMSDLFFVVFVEFYGVF